LGGGKNIFYQFVSIGLVVINADTQSKLHVLSTADAACYAFKNNGRNRVHVYQLTIAGWHNDVTKCNGYQNSQKHGRRITLPPLFQPCRFLIQLKCIERAKFIRLEDENSEHHNANGVYSAAGATTCAPN